MVLPDIRFVLCTIISMSKRRVVIGLPGNTFNNSFLLSWTKTLYALWDSNKYDIVVAPGTSSFVSFARMKTLGLDVLRGKDQKPFNGMEYDVFVTLDSDIVFSPEQVMELIDSTETHPVVAGTYMMADGRHLAVVKDWNVDYFTKNGSFEFLTADGLEQLKANTDAKYVPVSYIGMGFMAIRREVLESLKYPYFHCELERFNKEDGTEIIEMCSEDVALCKNIQAAGFTVYMHTGLRVGHVKEIIL